MSGWRDLAEWFQKYCIKGAYREEDKSFVPLKKKNSSCLDENYIFEDYPVDIYCMPEIFSPARVFTTNW